MINVSYIRLLNAFESFANAHLQVKRFASDFPEQLPNFGTENEKYPILFVSPEPSVFDENQNQLTVTVYCFDIIEKDRVNINTILSDTNQILNDVYRWFKDGEIFGIDIVTDTPTATPLNNALLDYAAGWQMTITFDVDTYGICEIPFNESPVVITEVCDIVYSQYLTCETVAECPVIVAMQEEIDELQALDLTPDQYAAINNANAPTGANPFATISDLTPGFDCADLPACQTIIDIVQSIENEAQVRSDDDTVLQLNIDNEEAARAAADADLQNQIDNLPVPRLFEVLASGNATGGNYIDSDDSTSHFGILDNGIFDWSADNGGYLQAWIYGTPAYLWLGYGNTAIRFTNALIEMQGTVNIDSLTASQIVETNASKNLISAAKGTAYNKNFGTGAGTVTEGNDSRILNRVWTFATDASIGAATSGTSNTLSKSILIPANTIQVGDVIRIRSFSERTGVLGSHTQRFYVNKTNDLTTPNLIGTQGAALANFLGGARTLIIRSATETLAAPSTSNLNDDEAAGGSSTVAPQIINIDWTVDQYIIIALQCTNALDSSFNNYLGIVIE